MGIRELNVTAIYRKRLKPNENGARRPLDVKVGDKIIFGKYSGQTVKADGEELLVMREEDIFGIVEK
ncbi:chaperonin 10 Kd subunit [Neisseria meningitidis NM604]|nr:chaperonin 10 Kd subunit [Neisseria meningitidis NM604]